MIHFRDFLKEGNLYNVQTITHPKGKEGTGLEVWKNEVKKQLLKHLKRQNIKNIDQVFQQTFGTTLD